MAEKILICRALMEDMYQSIEYFNRHLDTMSFAEMHEMTEMIDRISRLLTHYDSEETRSSVNSVRVHWSQLKIRAQRALMNSRVVLCC